jgi:plastocyanin
MAAPPIRHLRRHRYHVSAGLLCTAWAALYVTGIQATGDADLRGIVRAAGRPAPHAVVWLDAPAAALATPAPKIVLDQRNLKFSPHVLAVRVGTTVHFPNNDRVFHNVFSFHDGKVFDLGLYPVGASKDVRFDKPGLSRIFCNIHPKMAAYVFAVDSPYFAVSDESGEFAMPSVPPGRYTWHAWRASAPQLTGVWVHDGTGVRDAFPVEWAK